MKKNNMTRKYVGTYLFGSIFSSLFDPIKEKTNPDNERYIPINMRRAR